MALPDELPTLSEDQPKNLECILDGKLNESSNLFSLQTMRPLDLEIVVASLGMDLQNNLPEHLKEEVDVYELAQTVMNDAKNVIKTILVRGGAYLTTGDYLGESTSQLCNRDVANSGPRRYRLGSYERNYASDTVSWFRDRNSKLVQNAGLTGLNFAGSTHIHNFAPQAVERLAYEKGTKGGIKILFLDLDTSDTEITESIEDGLKTGKIQFIPNEPPQSFLTLMTNLMQKTFDYCMTKKGFYTEEQSRPFYRILAFAVLRDLADQAFGRVTLSLDHYVNNYPEYLIQFHKQEDVPWYSPEP